MKELTVFIKVNIDSLNASSLSMPEIVNIKDNIDNDKIKIMTDTKYLEKSSFEKLKLKKDNLFVNKLLGFEWETSSLIENLNNKSNLKNLIPELVEKKEPPIIIRIRKIKDKSLGTLREKPMFEIELQIASKIDEKLSSIFKKRKKKLTKKIKYKPKYKSSKKKLIFLLWKKTKL